MLMILYDLDVYLEGKNLHKESTVANYLYNKSVYIWTKSELNIMTVKHMSLWMDVMWRTILQVVNGRIKAQRELFCFVFICILWMETIYIFMFTV